MGYVLGSHLDEISCKTTVSLCMVPELAEMTEWHFGEPQYHCSPGVCVCVCKMSLCVTNDNSLYVNLFYSLSNL